MAASSSGGAPVPSNVPDGSDDDIVARQLREAAMNEEDPELREKLWQEYIAYKTGTGGPGAAAEKAPPKDPESGEDETDQGEATEDQGR